MKIEFTHQSPGCHRLILIFAGWSTDTSLYASIKKKDWDVAIVSDYLTLDFSSEILKTYSTIYLYCWSLGVWAASNVIDQKYITRAFAINGTEHPVSDIHGIPKKIFQGTAETLSDRNLLKFRKRLLGQEYADRLPELEKCNSSIKKLSDELFAIMKLSDSPNFSHIRWERVYIGREDKIFPPQNQKRAWEAIQFRCKEICFLNAPHYIDLQEIVNATIPDLEKMGRRFYTSSSSYDNNAIAQTQIAKKLTELIQLSDLSPNPNILEIGQGTGLFTRLYSKKINPSKAEFVDIYPTARFGIAPEEIYHVCDAEQWLEYNNSTYDLILSASTIQWFRNSKRFFQRTSQLLNSEGELICSTFLPGTLDLFDNVRPSPMLYPTTGELEQMIKEFFGEVYLEELKVELKFNNVKDALMHLKATGVGGAFGRFGEIRDIINALSAEKEKPTLHFNALLIKASNPTNKMIK